MTSEKDTRVSAAYREAASDKAPEHLDRAILDEAGRAARPAYARSRAWTRPLAWAATIALSVAIVLELTRVDVEVHDKELAPARLQEPAALEEEAPAAPVPATGTAAPVKSENVPEARLRNSSDSPRQVPAEDFEMQDKDLLRRADEAAELRYGEEKADTNAAADMALRSAALVAEAPPQCPEDATRDPETWLACIEELEAAGLTDAAAEQRRLLADAFPEFELP